jgi:hypothetical protein
MKKGLLGIVALGVALLLLLAGSIFCFYGAYKVIALPSSSEPTISESGSAQVAPQWAVYQEKMANGEIWYAYGKGEVWFWQKVKPGMELSLTNLKEETFQARIIQVFTLPAGSKSKGTWIEFENLTLKRGQPYSGPAVIFKKWLF